MSTRASLPHILTLIWVSDDCSVVIVLFALVPFHFLFVSALFPLLKSLLTVPCLSFSGCVVPPLMPQMVMQPNGTVIQMMVPNPYYNPQFAAYSVATTMQPYDAYGNPIYPDQAVQDGASTETAAVAAEGAEVAAVTEGVAAVSVQDTTAASTEPIKEAPPLIPAVPALVPVAPVPALIASPAVSQKKAEALAPPAGLTKPASAAPAATVVQKSVEKESAFKAATAQYLGAAANKPLPAVTAAKSGKHVYDKATLISLYTKSTYTVSTKLKEVYANYAAVEREPIGFYFASPNMISRSGNSSNNLAGHGSSGNLNNMRNDGGNVQRGAKVPGNNNSGGGNKHNKHQKEVSEVCIIVVNAVSNG